METPRNLQLKKWMSSRNITLRAVAEQLGISISGVNAMLSRQTIPTLRHAQLVSLGFPSDLLPDPMDITPGPKPKEPDFPGLARA